MQRHVRLPNHEPRKGEQMNYLKQFQDILNNRPILFTDSSGNPSGVAGLGDVSETGFHLGLDLAAHSNGTADEISAVLTKHLEKVGQGAFHAVLVSATFSMLAHYLSPAIDQIDEAADENLREALLVGLAAYERGDRHV